MRNLWRAALLVWLCWGIALLLAGCGGSYVEEREADNRPAICQNHPRACI